MSAKPLEEIAGSNVHRLPPTVTMDPVQAEAIAKVAHEANRTYCRELGDLSHDPWDLAPLYQRRSSVKGVLFLHEHPDAGPEACHESWMRQMLAEGWGWGPTKDPELKEHPCIVPWIELSIEQRRKDQLFLGIVRALTWVPGR